MYGTLIVQSLKKNGDTGATRRLASTKASIKTVTMTFKADTWERGAAKLNNYRHLDTGL